MQKAGRRGTDEHMLDIKLPLTGEHFIPAEVEIWEVTDRRAAVAAELGSLRKVAPDPNETDPDHPRFLSDEEVEQTWRDGLRSPHNRMQEMIEITGQIKNCSRAFTHQFVRGRVGWKYSQQSMRWIDATDYEVYTPPLLDPELPAPPAPDEKLHLRLYQDRLAAAENGVDPRVAEARRIWRDAHEITQRHYARIYELLESYLLASGNRQPGPTAAQDVRGILPTNVLTNIAFSCSYLSLQNAAKSRLCHAAQHEIRYIFEEIKRKVHEIEPELGKGLKIMCQNMGYCPMPYYEHIKCSLPLAGVPAPKKVQSELYEILTDEDLDDTTARLRAEELLLRRDKKEVDHPDD